MATTVNLRGIIDRPAWEMVATPAQSYGIKAQAASTQWDKFQLWTGDYTTLYDPKQDAWLYISANPVGLGSYPTAYHPNGPTGTATAGTSTTITTALTLPGGLAKYSIRTTGGTGAGQERVIAGNTIGANSVITVTTPWTTTPDNSTTFTLITGRFWQWATASLRYYDVATGAWSAALSVSGSTTVGTLIATPSFGNVIATGTATSGSSTTLSNSGKAWTTNQWTNYQVRITGGTGIGQSRIITSNTATALTVATWTTNPDFTSVYSIEPDDNSLYGFNGTTTYKYSISGNTWSTLTPGVARTTAALATSGYFVGVASDTYWADETAIKNGRYIYSFGTTYNLAVYDIALNTWSNPQLTYLTRGATLAPTSPQAGQDREFLYFMQQPTISTTTGNIVAGVSSWRFNCVTQTLDAWGYWNLPISGSSPDPHVLCSTYNDGSTTITYVYAATALYYDPRFFRQLVIG